MFTHDNYDDGDAGNDGGDDVDEDGDSDDDDAGLRRRVCLRCTQSHDPR